MDGQLRSNEGKNDADKKMLWRRCENVKRAFRAELE
jgi:hypothetical protein